MYCPVYSIMVLGDGTYKVRYTSVSSTKECRNELHLAIQMRRDGFTREQIKIVRQRLKNPISLGVLWFNSKGDFLEIDANVDSVS